jgi:hypothetical protein
MCRTLVGIAGLVRGQRHRHHRAFSDSDFAYLRLKYFF